MWRRGGCDPARPDGGPRRRRQCCIVLATLDAAQRGDSAVSLRSPLLSLALYDDSLMTPTPSFIFLIYTMSSACARVVDAILSLIVAIVLHICGSLHCISTAWFRYYYTVSLLHGSSTKYMARRSLTVWFTTDVCVDLMVFLLCSIPS